jgi:hypothetical protein
MGIENLPQISLGTAALIIFLGCAVYVIARGMIRMMVGTLVIAASAWLGYRAWQMAPELSIEWFDKLSPAVLYGLPAAVFLVAFFILRVILKFLTKPFAEKADAHREDRFSPRRLLFRIPLLIIPTALLWLLGAVIVHHIGAVQEIRTVQAETPAEPGTFARLKAQVAKILPAAWLAKLDPLTSPDRVEVAKLIAAQEAAPRGGPVLEPVIDPETGKPYPRAIIVESPELQGLAREQHFGTLLRHPQLDKLMQDPEVKRWIARLGL